MGFAGQALIAGGGLGASGDALGVLVDAFAQPLGKPLNRVRAVKFLGTVLLGFDDQHALASEAFIADGEKALFYLGWQGAGGYVQAQVNGA